jgi:hypothetical protein
MDAQGVGTIAEAARALRLSPRQILRDISQGAPVARRGGRGRGRATLIDIDALAAWRRSQQAREREFADVLTTIAAELPELCATATHDLFVSLEGPHKRDSAGALAAAWFVVLTCVLDRLRRDAPNVPELSALPEKITRLRRIFSVSATLHPSSSLRRD